MHSTNYKGWQRYAAFPFGIWMVDIPAIFKTMENKGLQTGIIVELNPSNDDPVTLPENRKNQ
jgi:hypothetical protein